jgi:predicted  nucleic acid-binding Zn-ribbon protein
MPAKDLGNKHVCFKCGTKFYDMRKPEAVCPKCGADQKDSPANRPAPEPRRGRLAAVPRPVEPAPPEPEPEAAEDETEDLDSFDDDEDVTPDDED